MYLLDQLQQAAIRGHLAAARYRRIKAAAVTIQAAFRAFSAARKFAAEKRKIVVVQSAARR
jgi:hypothetical protein